MAREQAELKTRKDDGGLRTVVGSGTTITGKIAIQGSGRIDGSVEGEVVVSDTVAIGADGLITGDVVADAIIISGKVKGNVYASRRVVLEAKAVLIGDLVAPKVVIGEGTRFNGNCNMMKSREIVIDKKSKEMRVVEMTPEEILTSR
jgi:cytoskeletal protein CcmA (bactofilin family)